jgi:oxygen-independent coproporphyrinogen-3 oxidase
MPLGLYISVPFCRTKCTYCNFASEVFSKAVFQRYVDRICEDLAHASTAAERLGGSMERSVDSVYFGGGTPTLLDINQLERLFVTIWQNFDVEPDAEITVECAPGTLTPAVIEVFCRRVNRVSLGVQSFVDQEASSVGRLHNRTIVLDDITRLRAAGISNLNLDLIAGLPHQTAHSWDFSLEQVIAAEGPHVSVYMLEVDDDSRLGREVMAGGTKYHAHFVPNEDLTANMYEMACDRLQSAGIHQYEISNFARVGFESRHNLKYWTRQPYLGFGVDAHSMLRVSSSHDAVRFATPDSLEGYVAGTSVRPNLVDGQGALEETFFLGLRLNRGIDLERVAADFGSGEVSIFAPVIEELVQAGLLDRQGSVIRLTGRGRLLSNEVFERFLVQPSSK